MRAGKGSSDAYLEEWRRVSSACEAGQDLRACAEQEALRLESDYTDERLLQLIRAHGVDNNKEHSA